VNLRNHRSEETQTIVQLFESVFADSEGDAEGTLIRQLAKELFATTNEHDLFNYVAVDDGEIVGSIFFSRLNFENHSDAFILAPVAVSSDRQGAGIGQRLIRYGLTDLKKQGIRTVITYGDPAFYRKVDFHQISHRTVNAPFNLSQPEGWLGQSLVGDPIEALAGRCTCVEALNNPVYW